MDDDRREARWSGDPLIAEEARRLLAEHRRRVEESDVPARRWVYGLAITIGFAGPFFAIMTLMGGGGLVFPITAGSCAMAGLLIAAVDRGIRGAVNLLVIPIGWVMLGAGLVLSSGWTAPPPEAVGYLAGFLLVQAGSAEAGYFAGRLLPELIQSLMSIVRAR